MTTKSMSTYHERVETTHGSAHALWAWWVDVPRWGDWAGWCVGASLREPFREGSQGTLIDSQGRKSTFTITRADALESFEIEVSFFGATMTILGEILECENDTVFRHSCWLSGPLSRLWARMLHAQWTAEAHEGMRKLAHLADDRPLFSR